MHIKHEHELYFDRAIKVFKRALIMSGLLLLTACSPNASPQNSTTSIPIKASISLEQALGVYIQTLDQKGKPLNFGHGVLLSNGDICSDKHIFEESSETTTAYADIKGVGKIPYPIQGNKEIIFPGDTYLDNNNRTKIDGIVCHNFSSDPMVRTALSDGSPLPKRNTKEISVGDKVSIMTQNYTPITGTYTGQDLYPYVKIFETGLISNKIGDSGGPAYKLENNSATVIGLVGLVNNVNGTNFTAIYDLNQ